MTRMAFDAQDLGDYLELLARFAEHFEPHAAADIRQLPRQVNQRFFRPDVFSNTFGNDVRAARFVPLSAYFKAREITWTRSVFGFECSGHGYSSSALSFSSTEKSSSVVPSPATVTLVAISRNNRRMILPDRVFARASVNLISSGRASAPISFTTCSRRVWFSASDGVCDPSSVTKATIDDPFNSSGRGTTAASATAECETRALSISAVPSLCPLTLITSSIRPMIQKYPSLSFRAPSPAK